MGAAAEGTYQGYISSTHDALLIFECVRRGILPKVNRRLRDDERKMIRSGQVFVFDEKESGIKRWTDGLLWSPSRILWNFLVYRQVEKRQPIKPGSAHAEQSLERSASGSGLNFAQAGPTAQGGTAIGGGIHNVLPFQAFPTQAPTYNASVLGRPGSEQQSQQQLQWDAVPSATVGHGAPQRMRSVSSADDTFRAWQNISFADPVDGVSSQAQNTTRDANDERSLVGSLTTSYPFAKDGLCKKTISIQVENSTQHLISYYTLEDVKSGRLRTPSSLPEIASLSISPIFLTKTTFRFPPIVAIGPDGVPRFRADETQDLALQRYDSNSEGTSSGSDSNAQKRAMLSLGADRRSSQQGELSLQSISSLPNVSQIPLSRTAPHLQQMTSSGIAPRNRGVSDAAVRPAQPGRYEPYGKFKTMSPATAGSKAAELTRPRGGTWSASSISTSPGSTPATPFQALPPGHSNLGMVAPHTHTTDDSVRQGFQQPLDPQQAILMDLSSPQQVRVDLHASGSQLSGAADIFGSGQQAVMSNFENSSPTRPFGRSQVATQQDLPQSHSMGDPQMYRMQGMTGGLNESSAIMHESQQGVMMEQMPTDQRFGSLGVGDAQQEHLRRAVATGNTSVDSDIVQSVMPSSSMEWGPAGSYEAAGQTPYTSRDDPQDVHSRPSSSAMSYSYSQMSRPTTSASFIYRQSPQDRSQTQSFESLPGDQSGGLFVSSADARSQSFNALPTKSLRDPALQANAFQGQLAARDLWPRLDAPANDSQSTLNDRTLVQQAGRRLQPFAPQQISGLPALLSEEEQWPVEENADQAARTNMSFAPSTLPDFADTDLYTNSIPNSQQQSTSTLDAGMIGVRSPTRPKSRSSSHRRTPSKTSTSPLRSIFLARPQQE